MHLCGASVYLYRMILSFVYAFVLCLSIFMQDDSPVYLFDNKFRGAGKVLLEEFQVPKYFPDDYMGLRESDRPPYRWAGFGPERSGTVMHQVSVCSAARCCCLPLDVDSTRCYHWM